MGKMTKAKQECWKYWATRYVTLTNGKRMPDVCWSINELITQTKVLEQSKGVTYDVQRKCYVRPLTRWERIVECIKMTWQVLTGKE